MSTVGERLRRAAARLKRDRLNLPRSPVPKPALAFRSRRGDVHRKAKHRKVPSDNE